MKLLRLSLTLVLIILAEGRAHAQNLSEGVDYIIKNVCDSLKLESAVVVAVVKGGEVIYEKVHGYADVSDKIKADVNTPFYIASTTKSYICVLAKLLEKEGLLELDDSISKYLPSLAFKDPRIDANQITLRDLLTHQSGLQNEPIIIRTSFTGEDTENISKLKKFLIDSNFTGKTFSYSNLGYILFGIILEDLTGKSWKQLLADRLFLPLEMEHTSASISHLYSNKKIHPALGHTVKNNKTEVASLQKADVSLQAGGGIFSSLRDSERWLLLHMGYKVGGLLLNQKLLSEIHTVQVQLSNKFYSYQRFGYDLGWYHSTYKGETLIQCFGSFAGGHRAHTSFIPDKGIGVIVFANAFPEAIFLPDLIANHVYDVLLESEPVSDELSNLIVDYIKTVKLYKPYFGEHSETTEIKIDERLLGKYYNNLWGTLEVFELSQQLFLKWGSDGLVKTKLYYKGGNMYGLGLRDLFGENDNVEIYYSQNTNSPLLNLHRGNETILFGFKGR